MGGNGLTYLISSLKRSSTKRLMTLTSWCQIKALDDLIEKRCEYYSDRVDIKYHRFDGPRRAANNVNNAMKLATGEILKPLFVDDRMFEQTHLKLTFVSTTKTQTIIGLLPDLCIALKIPNTVENFTTHMSHRGTQRFIFTTRLDVPVA